MYRESCREKINTPHKKLHFQKYCLATLTTYNECDHNHPKNISEGEIYVHRLGRK